jgi:hypothetical protein
LNSSAVRIDNVSDALYMNSDEDSFSFHIESIIKNLILNLIFIMPVKEQRLLSKKKME